MGNAGAGTCINHQGLIGESLLGEEDLCLLLPVYLVSKKEGAWVRQVCKPSQKVQTQPSRCFKKGTALHQRGNMELAIYLSHHPTQI